MTPQRIVIAGVILGVLVLVLLAPAAVRERSGVAVPPIELRSDPTPSVSPPSIEGPTDDGSGQDPADDRDQG